MRNRIEEVWSAQTVPNTFRASTISSLTRIYENVMAQQRKMEEQQRGTAAEERLGDSGFPVPFRWMKERVGGVETAFARGSITGRLVRQLAWIEWDIAPFSSNHRSSISL
jgi:hypothetical protein